MCINMNDCKCTGIQGKLFKPEDELKLEEDNE
jgi:hypothetical protein